MITDGAKALAASITEARARTEEKAAKRRATKLANGDPAELHREFTAAVKETWPEAAADLSRKGRHLKFELEKLPIRANRPVQPVANAVRPYKVKATMNEEDALPVWSRTFTSRDDEAA